MRSSIASTIWRFSTTRMLHEYVERLYLPAAAADAGAGAARSSAGRHLAALRGHAVGTQDLAGPGDPQPPTRRQLRLGVRRGLRAGVPADARGPRAPPGRPALAPLHGPAAGVARRRAARLPAAAARPRRSGPGGGPGRRPVRAGPGVAAGARPRGPADADGRPHRGHRRAATARRVAGGAGLGARPADGARGRGLPLDDPRRPALPGGLDPRGEPVGRVHHRGPGPAAHGVRHRAGAALPDPVRGGRGRHRLSPRPRDRGGRPGRDDGRRRREVRRLAVDLRPLLGRGPLGRSVLRGARGEPRLAHDGHAVAVARARAADRARLRAHVLVRGDGRVGPAGRRDGRVHPPAPPGGGGSPSRGALAARRLLAQLPGQVPRDQRPPQADAADVGQGRRDADGAGEGRGRSTTSTAASRTTATGTACSAGSTSRTCAWRPTSTSSPPRTRPIGPGRPGRCRRRRMARPRPRRPARGAARGRRPGRGGQARRGRRDRRLGHPRGPARAGGRAATAARGLPRDPPRPRRGGGRAIPTAPQRRRRPAGDDGEARVDPRHRDGQGGRASRPACSTTTTSGVPGSSGSCRRTRPRRRSRPPPRPSWATSAMASSRSTTSRPARCRCRATAPWRVSRSRSASRSACWATGSRPSS